MTTQATPSTSTTKEVRVRVSLEDHGDLYLVMAVDADDSDEDIAEQARQILKESIDAASVDIASANCYS